MVYEAHILHQDESIVSRNDTDTPHLLAWLLTQLESHVDRNTLGVIKNLTNQQEPARVYTNNPHY